MIAFLLLCSTVIGSPFRGTAQVDEVRPALIRAGERVSIRGSGFGAYDPGNSEVLFDTGGGMRSGGTPRVWRDDLIEVQVPTGQSSIDSLQVMLSGVSVASVPVNFVIAPNAQPTFSQRTQIVNHQDVSSFLGRSNLAQTRDAEVGDVNDDGWPDLIDNNSSNQANNTHSVLRLNEAGQGFRDLDWEPVDSNDSGFFAVDVAANGDFVESAITRDADFIDLNNDLLPDWVMVTSGRLRVAINGHLGVPGQFRESTDTWLGPQQTIGWATDVCSADVNGDGFLDVMVGLRFTEHALIYVNNNGRNFHPPITLTGMIVGFQKPSVHDVVFLDANDDGFWDVLLCNEAALGDSQVLLHNQDNQNPNWTPGQSFCWVGFSGTRGDFNGDQLDDIALGSFFGPVFFLNNPASPGFFGAPIFLPWYVSSLIYDVETGDINLDGHLDLVCALTSSSQAEDTVRVLYGNGDGTMTNQTAAGASALLPNPAPYERLSADLIDFDLDGDLDLYITGSAGQGATGAPPGSAPNQFWENELFDNDGPLFYCSGKQHSSGCVPDLSSEGVASLTSPVPFDIVANLILNQRNGFFFYGNQQNNAPFFGGVLCVQEPLRRTPISNSGGNPPPADCSGTLVFDFNTWIQAGNEPSVVAGSQVNGQFWFRDPLAADGTGVGLSNAIEFDVSN